MTPPEALFTITMYAVGCDVKQGHPTKAQIQPVVGFTAAADPTVLPIGSIVYVDGFGERLVHDVGGLVKGRHLDLFVANCGEARRWGRRVRTIHILHTPVSGEKKK